MPGKNDIYHSILIVSAAEQFDRFIRKSFPVFSTVETARSAALARRSILEKYYDIVVINAPLPDENGESFAVDVTGICSASVLIVTPQDRFEGALERVTDHGIMVMPKPSPGGRIDKSVRFLLAVQNRFHRLEKRVMTLEEKMEEIRTVSKAKVLLVERLHMTEDEAHRYIGKQAMDQGISRKRAAERILEEENP